jgi:hypothetical protein
MSRWPMLVALSLALPTFGCGGGFIAGLANAPSINRTAPDESVHDVVANGSDVCGRNLGRSPLRGHVPRCHAETAPTASMNSLHAKPPSEGDDLATPWLQHLYAGWPCPRPSARATSALASPAAEPPAASCTPTSP